MGGLGLWEILIILVIVLVIFGAGKLPKVMGDLGAGIRNFKAGMNDGGVAKDEPPAPAKTDDTPKA